MDKQKSIFIFAKFQFWRALNCWYLVNVYCDYFPQPQFPQPPHKSKRITRVQASMPQQLLLPQPQRLCKMIIQRISEHGSQQFPQPPHPFWIPLKKFICSSYWSYVIESSFRFHINILRIKRKKCAFQS